MDADCEYEHVVFELCCSHESYVSFPHCTTGQTTMADHDDPTKLDRTLTHQSETHSYKIPWTSLGSDDAPALILVHGTPWSSRVWAPYAKAFSSHFKVYLFDNPGYGEASARNLISAETDPDSSETQKLDASLAAQAEAFSILFKSWNFPEDKPPHVIAHDNGGLITLRANLLHGCKYASLCLLDVVAVCPFGSPFFRLVAANEETFKAIPDSVFSGILRGYIEGASYKPLSTQIMDMLVTPWLPTGKQGKEGFIRQMVQADQKHAEEVDSRYGEVGAAMPVKIVWGTEDKWIPVDRAHKLASMIGTENVVLIEEAGHLVMFDQPERVAVELSWWLSQQVHSKS